MYIDSLLRGYESIKKVIKFAEKLMICVVMADLHQKNGEIMKEEF